MGRVPRAPPSFYRATAARGRLTSPTGTSTAPLSTHMRPGVVGETPSRRPRGPLLDTPNKKKGAHAARCTRWPERARWGRRGAPHAALSLPGARGARRACPVGRQQPGGSGWRGARVGAPLPPQNTPEKTGVRAREKRDLSPIFHQRAARPRPRACASFFYNHVAPTHARHTPSHSFPSHSGT